LSKSLDPAVHLGTFHQERKNLILLIPRCLRRGFHTVRGVPASGPAPGGGSSVGEERPALHLRRDRQREDAHHAGRPPGGETVFGIRN